MKLCCYCHYRPRREGSAYCCDAHADAKYKQNHSDPEKRRRQISASRAKRKAAGKMPKKLTPLQRARKILNEEDTTPHRLQPEQHVSMWNVITNEIKTVEL